MMRAVSRFPLCRAAELDTDLQPQRWLIESLWADEAVGIVGGEEIRTMPLLRRSRRRLTWLSVNILLNIMAASVIALFQDTLSSVIALAAAGVGWLWVLPLYTIFFVVCFVFF